MEVFSCKRPATKADIAVGTDQHQTAMGKTIAMRQLAVWIVELLCCPLLLAAPVGAPDDLANLYHIPEVCQHEVHGLSVGFTLLREDEQGMARARKPLEETMRCIPIERPDVSIRSTVPGMQTSTIPGSLERRVLNNRAVTIGDVQFRKGIDKKPLRPGKRSNTRCQEVAHTSEYGLMQGRKT